jgi:hypothetical protein
VNHIGILALPVLGFEGEGPAASLDGGVALAHVDQQCQTLEIKFLILLILSEIKRLLAAEAEVKKDTMLHCYTVSNFPVLNHFPAGESFVSDILAGDGKIAYLFLQCIMSFEIAPHR